VPFLTGRESDGGEEKIEQKPVVGWRKLHRGKHRPDGANGASRKGQEGKAPYLMPFEAAGGVWSHNSLTGKD